MARKHARKRQADSLVSLDLRDAVDFVLDRILDRHDVHGLVAKFVDQAVERRGLAASGRPDHEENALRAADPRPQLLFEGLRESDLAPETSQYCARLSRRMTIFSPHREGSVETRASSVPVASALMCPSCGTRRSATSRLRHHLDANDKVVVQPSRQFRGLPKCAVNATAHARGSAAGLNVNVAGAESRRLRERSFSEFEQWEKSPRSDWIGAELSAQSKLAVVTWITYKVGTAQKVT